MAVLSRRSFLAAALAMPMLTVPSRAIGTYGALDLWQIMARGFSVDEGQGPEVRILVAPGCDHAGSMWEASRAYADRLRMRWMPVYEGIESNRAQVAACLSEATPDAVRRMISNEERDWQADAVGATAADLQEVLYQEEIARLLWESTGRTPAMPTLVFRSDPRRCKVVRGSIRTERFEEVLAEAWDEVVP